MVDVGPGTSALASSHDSLSPNCRRIVSLVSFNVNRLAASFRYVAVLRLTDSAME
jgi:hypothetical protein